MLKRNDLIRKIGGEKDIGPNLRECSEILGIAVDLGLRKYKFCCWLSWMTVGKLLQVCALFLTPAKEQ